MSRKRVKIPVREENNEHTQASQVEASEAEPATSAPQEGPASTAEGAPVSEAPAEAQAPEEKAAPTPEPADVEALKAEVERLKEELSQARAEAELYKDQYLRAVAEMDNLRKRLEKRYADEARQEKERFLRQILPLVDHLEMVIKHSESDPKVLRQGVQMILQDLMRTLEREGVQPIKSVGEKFDPFVHEAVEVVETSEVPPETVVDEVQRGYTYQGRLLRPARVRVARPAEAGSQASEAPSDTSA